MELKDKTHRRLFFEAIDQYISALQTGVPASGVKMEMETLLSDSPSLMKVRDTIRMHEAGNRFIRFKVSVPN